VPGAAGRRYFRNAGRTDRRGVEAGVELAVGATTIASAYSYSDFRFDDYDVTASGVTTSFDGKRIPGIPVHQFQAAVTQRWRPVFATAEVVASSRQYVDDANSSSAAGWAIANVRAGGRIQVGGAELLPVVGVNNVFDRRYPGSIVINATGGRHYEPAPERSISVGLTVTTGR
jgi:iron complex outermembrane recepter protein